MADSCDVKVVRWEDMPREKVTDMLERRIITGDKMMITHVYLKKGALVQMHSHEHEQIAYILEGALKFWIGSRDSEPIILSAGEVMVIPSNVPHEGLALEDTLDVDIFCPPREDWLNKTDDYLRK
jgi:quercetin dioxygenase-like cupin family protein